MSGTQRKLRNLLVTPKFQIKISIYFVATGLVFFGTIMVVAYHKLMQVRALMNENPVMNLHAQNQVNDLMFQIVTFTLAGFVVYIIASSLFALIVSHRIAGPVIAIVGFIEQLKEGNYDYTRNLRPHDELNEIMDALKDLAPVLKERAKPD